jgi:hypothetical protein
VSVLVIAKRDVRACLIAGVLLGSLAACGNQSVNVLTSRDARDAAIDGEAGEPPPDTSVDDAPTTPDAVFDGVVDLSIDVTIDASVDAPRDLSSDPTMDRSIDVSSDGALDVPPDRNPTGCFAVGGSCSFAAQCCTLACPDGMPRVCGSGPTCAPAGQDCVSNADCCGNRCVSAKCEGIPVGACRPAGELCSAAGDCCGGVCAPSGGASRCALLDACRVVGEVCVTNADCCSQVCGANSQGLSVCVAAPACDAPGNSCSRQGGDRCAVDAQCCSGACRAQVDGVLRCTITTCGGECAACSEDRDCCAGATCGADGMGYLRCRPRPEGGADASGDRADGT